MHFSFQQNPGITSEFLLSISTLHVVKFCSLKFHIWGFPSSSCLGAKRTAGVKGRGGQVDCVEDSFPHPFPAFSLVCCCWWGLRLGGCRINCRCCLRGAQPHSQRCSNKPRSAASHVWSGQHGAFPAGLLSGTSARDCSSQQPSQL